MISCYYLYSNYLLYTVIRMPMKKTKQYFTLPIISLVLLLSMTGCIQSELLQVTKDNIANDTALHFSYSSVTGKTGEQVSTVPGGTLIDRVGIEYLNFHIRGAVLPEGLALDPNSGIIIGTGLTVKAEAEYTVAATVKTENAVYTGSKETTLRIGIIQLLETLTLNYAAISKLVGQEIQTIMPAGTSIDKIGISDLDFQLMDAVPNGIIFDTSSGAISGTAGAILAKQDFTIKARVKNGHPLYRGSVESFVTITIYPDLETLTLSYSDLVVNVDAEVSTAPTGSLIGWASTDDLDFQISPELPIGLIFSTATGTITGAAQAELTETEYTVTATVKDSHAIYTGSVSGTILIRITPKEEVPASNQ